MKCSWGRHPNTPPSGVQTSLMLAAAAGLNPLAMGSGGEEGYGQREMSEEGRRACQGGATGVAAWGAPGRAAGSSLTRAAFAPSLFARSHAGPRRHGRPRPHADDGRRHGDGHAGHAGHAHGGGGRAVAHPRRPGALGGAGCELSYAAGPGRVERGGSSSTQRDMCIQTRAGGEHAHAPNNLPTPSPPHRPHPQGQAAAATHLLNGNGQGLSVDSSQVRCAALRLPAPAASHRQPLTASCPALPPHTLRSAAAADGGHGALWHTLHQRRHARSILWGWRRQLSDSEGSRPALRRAGRCDACTNVGGAGGRPTGPEQVTPSLLLNDSLIPSYTLPSQVARFCRVFFLPGRPLLGIA